MIKTGQDTQQTGIPGDLGNFQRGVFLVDLVIDEIVSQNKQGGGDVGKPSVLVCTHGGKISDIHLSRSSIDHQVVRLEVHGNDLPDVLGVGFEDGL